MIAYKIYYVPFFVRSAYFKLTVSKPCTEDWAAMEPTGAGRHCLLCNKEVIDFSLLDDEQVKTFFIHKADQQVCGRFRKTQLDRIRINLPGYFFQKKIPAWKKYLVLFLICFGSSLYSIDISVGNSQGLHAQTPAAVMANPTKIIPQKKKKHKKKKRDKVIVFETIFHPGEMISGFIAIERHRPPEVTIPVCDLQKESKTNHDSSVKESIAYTNLPGKEERKPRNKTDFPKIEFILPAALSLRRKRRGRKN